MSTRGDRELAGHLAAVLEAAREAGPAQDVRRWTHGFHVYPARMHPAIAQAACARWVRPKTTVLDPFCGSGTVALEAMAAGARVIAADLNPLALRLSKLACTRLDVGMRAAISEYGERIVEETLADVKARVEVLAPLSSTERAYYDPHVLRELAVLHARVLSVGQRAVREALTMVFSAIVGKFSRQRADTRNEAIEKHIGKGVPTRFFGRKVQELVERLAALDTALPMGVRAPKWLECDVRELERHVTAGSVDMVITSPPYVGTYDYVDHHARRWDWLGITPRRFRRGELGARRDYATPDAADRWDRELTEVAKALCNLLSPSARMLWLIGDGEIGGKRIDAAHHLTELAPSAGLVVVASAAVGREDWRGGKPRLEHLVALRRA